MLEYLELAARAAIPSTKDDPRNFWLGCVGIRRDGVVVSSKNGAVFATDVDNYQLIPSSHAEVRTLRKMGKGGTIFVARVAKGTRSYAMARPCGACQLHVRAYNIDKVYYSINEGQYGIWHVSSDKDIVYNF